MIGMTYLTPGMLDLAKQPAPPITPEGSGMALSPGHPIPYPGSITAIPSVSDELRATGHLFGRWPLVPSRELRRIRQILLYAVSMVGAESTNDLSEPARDLLELVTAELQRRGQLDGPIQPAQSHSEQTHTRAWKKGARDHGRSL